MARIPDAFIDDVLARTDIVELIGARVPLKRAGREYGARCPFHDERSPSFTVSPTKQFYHCFGCGAHGTALKFLMEYDRLEFLDAVEELAKRVGMEVPRETRQHNENDESRPMYAALDASATFFRQQLQSNTKALAYLDRRGVDATNRERFAIGYAPEGFDALKNALGRDEAALRTLERVGMLSKSDSGRVYDKFRERVMFPIHDRRGRVIAFGGRVLEKDDGPKYLNSPETPLFHKGRELYGLWQVRQAHSKIPRLVVVEGYMDVVSLFQYGVDTAVATLGTATTPDHAELLFRNAADVYFCFDGDNAGRKAAWRALESVLPRMKDGRQAFFLFLPDGEDPDTIVRSEGAAGFDARLKDAMTLSDFMFDQLSRDVDVTTIDGKSRLAERAKQLIERIPDGEFKDKIAELGLRKTSVGAGAASAAWAKDLTDKLDDDFRRISKGQMPDGYAKGVIGKPLRYAGSSHTPKRSLVRSAISLLLQQPGLGLEVESTAGFEQLRQPGVALLLELIALVRARPDINTGALLEHFNEREEQTALQKLAAQSLPGDVAAWRMEFVDALMQLARQTQQQRVEELNLRMREGGMGALSDDEKAEWRELQVTSRK